MARALHRLGSFSRVIMFDKRGTGMSDRTDRLPDIDRRMLDIEAVMHAVGSEEAALLAVSEGGPMAILFAAAHPERTRALVLLNTYARITSCPDYPSGIPAAQLHGFAQYIEPGWGTGVGLSAWAPSVAQDPHARESFARVQRLASSPGAAMALLTSYLEIDVRAALPLVHAPTLVLHRTGDRMVPLALGHYVVDHIDGARLVEIAGTDHFWWTQNTDQILDEVEEFLTGARSVPESDRVLASVLFTDIVDSTRRAAELGAQRVEAAAQSARRLGRPPDRAPWRSARQDDRRRHPGDVRRPRPVRTVRPSHQQRCSGPGHGDTSGRARRRGRATRGRYRRHRSQHRRPHRGDGPARRSPRLSNRDRPRGRFRPRVRESGRTRIEGSSGALAGVRRHALIPCLVGTRARPRISASPPCRPRRDGRNLRRWHSPSRRSSPDVRRRW